MNTNANDHMLNLPTKPSMPRLPPKHERWDVPPSPKQLAPKRGWNTTSLENLPSDASIEISDITMEIEKISKDKEHPEEAIKDSNRLKKEIDHQMEMSFEIMEERSHMVREYLKEREKSEKKYKSKADRMVEQLNSKMNKLENSLNLSESMDGRPGIKSSSTQTLSVLQDTGVQASMGDQGTPHDFEEVMAALTQDIKLAVASQYAKERKALQFEFAVKKHSLDKDVLEETENDTLTNEEDKERKNIAGHLADEYLSNTNTSITNKDRGEVIKFLQKSDENDSLDFSAIEKIDLHEYKTRYLREVQQLITYSTNTAEEQLTKIIQQIRLQCLHVNQLKSKYHKLMTHLSKSEIPTNEIESRLYEIQSESSGMKKQTLTKKLVCDIYSSSNSGENVQNIIEQMLTHLDEISVKENHLKNVIIPQLTKSQETYWKHKLALAQKNNKILFQEKEDLIHQLGHQDSEWTNEKLIIRPTSNIYLESMEIDYERQEKLDDLLAVEGQIGENLIKEILHQDKQSQMKAVDIMKYQEKPIEIILKDYENNLNDLNESLQKSYADKDVHQMIGGEEVTDELIGRLSAEKVALKEQIVNGDTSYRHACEQLEVLKNRKDKIFTEEKSLKLHKSFLQRKLTDVNRQIADKCMNNEREKENLDREKRLIDVSSQIGELQKTLMQKSTPDQLENKSTSIAQISQRLGSLRNNLEKLLPFVNEKLWKSVQHNENMDTPGSESIDQLLATKAQLSNQLLHAEKKIQEIITSENYESSNGSGTMENIEEMQLDLPCSPSDRLKRSSPTSPQNLNLDLKTKLLNVEMELEQIHQKIKERGDLEITDKTEIERLCQNLSTTILQLEAKMILSQTPDDVVAIDKEIERLRKELQASGVIDTVYDSKSEEKLLEAKEATIEKLKEMRMNAKSTEDSDTVIALKDLLHERDRTKNTIMALNEDIKVLDEIKHSTSDHASFSTKIMETNTLLLDKKSDTVVKMAAIAKNRLSYFINIVKIKMKERLEEASKENWVNKDYLSKEEKQKLGKELHDIVTDIKTTEKELNAMAEYKQTGHINLIEELPLKGLFDTRKSLTEKIEHMEKQIQLQQQLSAGKDISIITNLQTEKSDLTIQLKSLEERIHSQDTILTERLHSLQNIKRGLETKLANAVDVNDLKQIIAELDKKDSPRFLTIEDDEEENRSLASLMEERKSLNDNIVQVLHTSPNEGGKIERMIDFLDEIDAEIIVNIEEVLESLSSAPVILADKEMEAFELLSTTASAFRFLHEKAEIERALEAIQSKQQHINVSMETVQQERKEITTLQCLQKTLTNFQNRGININVLEEIKTFKSLNDKKLDLLLTKIRNLNQLVDTQKTLDRKAKSIEELTVSDLQQISMTTEMINSELQSIVKCYDDDIINNDQLPEVDPYLQLPKKSTSDSLKTMLNKRDKMVNKLFLIEKEIEENNATLERRQQLHEARDEMNEEIELIDENIVSCQYQNKTKNDLRVTSQDEVTSQGVVLQTRSFSPRSTSSRTSFTVQMEERDQILRELFVLRKQNEDIEGKPEDIDVAVSETNDLHNHLKRLTTRILGNRDYDNALDVHNAMQVRLDQTSIHKRLVELESELEEDKIFLHHAENKTKTFDGDENYIPFTNPPELECLEDIRHFEKKLSLESMKKALQSLEEEKRIIEESINGGEARGGEFSTVRKALENTKNELKQNQEKLHLIMEKRKLENQSNDLKEKIDKNEKLSDKINELDHREFVKHENDISLKEYKRNKVKLEKKLDEIDSVLHRYVHSIEREIDNIVKTRHESDQQETADALQQHESDLKGLLISASKNLAGEKNVSLNHLLDTRRKTRKELQTLNENIERNARNTEKSELTKKICDVCEQEKQLTITNSRLRYKQEFLSQTLKNLPKPTNTPKKIEELEKLKKVIGEDLYNLLQNSSTVECTVFTDLKQCLEDRPLEVYIKDLQSLSKLQNDQVNHLKEELQTFVEKKQGELNRDHLEERIQFQTMIDKLQDELAVAERMRNRFKETLGEKIYQICNAEKSTSNDGNKRNFETKPNRYLENVKTILNQNEATLEQLLEQNFNDIERMSEQNEISAALITKINEEHTILVKNLSDRDEQIEALRKRDEHCSETESYRDNLRHRANSIAEEKLKQIETMTENIKMLTQQNNTLKEEKDELIKEFNETKKNLEISTKNIDQLSETEKSGRTELEIMRKKLTKMTRQKTALQESLENELKNIDSLQDDLNTLQQKDKQAVHSMHKNCNTIEKQEKEIKKSKDTICQMEKSNNEIQENLNDIKERYQSLSNKYQTESSKITKELRAARTKINAQQMEIERITNEQKDETLTERVQTSQNASAGEQSRQDEYQQRLDEQLIKNQSTIATLDEQRIKIQQLEKQKHDLSNENQALLSKLKDLDESFENEVTETRRELNEKFGNTIDKLNEKLRKLANDLVRLEKEKLEIEDQNQALKEQNADQLKDIKEQNMMLDGKKKKHKLEILSINTELNSFKLENDELREEILSLKKQVKQKDIVECLAKNLNEKRNQLEQDMDKFKADKKSFEENLQSFMRKKQYGHDMKTDDKVSIKLLKIAQDERDKFSDELIKTNRELHVARNELRKLKMNLREKEQDYAEEEKHVVQTIEQTYKKKLDEQGKALKIEKDQILMVYNDERNKWEEEMENLKQNLQEETMKKLAEQRNDYEKELEKQIQLYVKQNDEELEEERDKNARLEKQRLLIIEQVEEEKKKLTCKHELQRQAMVEIIKRLLKHLMLLKKQRTRLRSSYEDEINELEERLETEKKRLAEQKRTEGVHYKENEIKNNAPSKKETHSKSLKHFINVSQDERSKKTNAIRTKPEKESDANSHGEYKLSLTDLRDLIHMGDLKDIIDSDYEEEKDMMEESMREQYEVKLRLETDYLMRRLLELSDELDALRTNH